MKPIIIFFMGLLLFLSSSVSNCYADGELKRIELFEPDELDHVVGINGGLGIHFYGNVTAEIFNETNGTFDDVNIAWNDMFDRTSRLGIILGRRFHDSDIWMFLDINRFTWYAEQQMEVHNVGVFDLENDRTISMWEYALSFRYLVSPKKNSPFGLHFGPYVAILTANLFGGSTLFSGGALLGAHYAPFFIGENNRPILLNLDIATDIFSEDRRPPVLDISMSILVGFMK